MIVLFTDFGADDLYVGQVKAVLAHTAPGVPAIDLLHAAPNFDIESSAHLLAALYPKFSPGSVFFAVVDPGVGGARDAVVMVADGYWFVGPDNGLLSIIAARAQATRCGALPGGRRVCRQAFMVAIYSRPSRRGLPPANSPQTNSSS